MNPIVILESPYAGDIESNLGYARMCMKDSLHRGESPFASHLLYTQEGVLDDSNPSERTQGIKAGLEFYRVADKSVVYQDLGISSGMLAGIEEAAKQGVPIEYRRLFKD